MYLLKARYDLDEGTDFEACICNTIEEAKKVMLKKFFIDASEIGLPEEVHKKVVEAFKNDGDYQFDDGDVYVSSGTHSITVHVNGEEWYVYEIEEALEGLWY